MKTTELRLGNWIQGVRTYKDKTYTDIPMFVEAIFNDTIYADFEDNVTDVWEYTESEIQGIPLTNEALKQCGFKPTNFGAETHIMAVEWSYLRLKQIGNEVSVELSHKPNEIFRIKYVHELQNLYFTLTKEELTIKL